MSDLQITKEELITSLILLGFVKPTLQCNRYKIGRGMTLIIVDFNISEFVCLFDARHTGKNKLQVPYNEALNLCVERLNQNK